MSLGTTIIDVLEGQGALQARALTELGSVPYLFAFQKDRGPLSEAIAQNLTDTINTETTIFENWNEGHWRSAPVGPATKWNSATVTLGDRNLTETDSARYTLFGINQTGAERLLSSGAFNLSGSNRSSLDLSGYSATLYPHMRMAIDVFDNDTRTALTVRSVYFDYAPVGDAAINPQLAYSSPDSLEQGEPANFTLAYENLARVDMDSLLVELTIQDERNQIRTITKTQPPLAGGATGQVSFDVNTDEATNNFRYSIVLNPRQAQAEEVLFNNLLTNRVGVLRDAIDPLVQVLFDGNRINDGDLVSGRPEIHIQIKDENRRLILNDTSAYSISIRKPTGETVRYGLSGEAIDFRPGTAEDNTADIYFTPELDEDGTYTIEIMGRDRSSNLAGRGVYQKQFEVINRVAISNVLPYPNPFTTQTRFVYTLTGNTPPSEFRIQIMSVSGRVVRDIDLLETETLKAGTHQTTFVWDGTDEYGDRLANGVYLYRVIALNDDREAMEKHDTGTDTYFENGLGKIVLLR